MEKRGKGDVACAAGAAGGEAAEADKGAAVCRGDE